ncbi:type II toxin-antitoxin system RelE/ParE family toxin [Parachlamydia sp. AcF125]|uniref:type II toxin-antitoxin system RelE/ParE family toxin n=1 Tax=Parachlamydia sp. AcF125 TaxID=2795736 RepID=UPI00201695FE|nr:type II toxin-antitoxin system RelE/ParE family toxin [Parachlamydia sp. AcF125]
MKFEIWIEDIKEIHTRAKILTQLDHFDHLKLRKFGNCKALQKGVCELRIYCLPGVRISYGKDWEKNHFASLRGQQGLSRKRHRKGKGVFERLSI